MTAPTIDGLPDIDDRTPEFDVVVQIPLDAWRMATSWVAGAKPRAGSDNPMDQLNLRFTHHPHHYTDRWDQDIASSHDDDAVTLAVTDTYRLAFCTIASNDDVDQDNQLQYLSPVSSGTVSVDATDALKAMRGWPAIATTDTGSHAVEVRWDTDDRRVHITLLNAETGQRLASSILDLWDGLHDFPRHLTPPEGLPEMHPEFAVWPSFLKALSGAAAAAGHEVLDIRANHDRMIMLRADPVDLPSTTVFCTAALAPFRRSRWASEDTPDSTEPEEADDSPRPALALVPDEEDLS